MLFRRTSTTGLHCFTTNRFDVVILAHALQELTHPHIALQRMVDIADEAIVSFPNFGHWSCRLHLGVKGRMPMSRVMPRHWYDTPNIHFCTVTDFDALCSALHIDIIERATIAGPAQHFFGPLVAQSFRYQRHLPYPSLWRLIGLLLMGLAIEPALGSNPLVSINSSCTTVLSIQRSSHHRLPRSTASPEAPIKPF